MNDPLLTQTLTGVFRLAAPEIALVGTACVVFLFGCFYNRRWVWFTASVVGVIVAMILAAVVGEPAPPVLSAAPLIPDAAAAFVRWVALGTALVLALVAWAETDRTNAAEYYACLLVVAAGASLVGRANDLVTLFLALELLSIPTYILLYLPARTKLNEEAAAKYFLLSVMSSAVLLFGFSYLYGLTGSLNLTVIVDAVTKAHAEPNGLNPMALVAAVLVIAALGFRVTAVPFHFYAPDVYEGGPAGVVAQLAFLPKLAGFVALARVLGLIGGDPRHLPFDAHTQVPLLLWIIAVMTMCLGNVLALLQDNVRRMLAYSSVAHGGYMLMGVVIAGAVPDAKAAPAFGGIDALLVYLVAYGMMTVGAFAVILYLSTPGRPVEAIDDLAGLSQSHPVSAAALGVFLFSLIGLPPTAGFVGKLFLFIGAFDAPADTPTMRNLYLLLAVIAAVNAAVGAYYYLRVIGVMYLRTPLRPLVSSRAVPTFVAAVALAVATLAFPLYAGPIGRAASQAAAPSAPAKGTADAR
jgi:NADH-quinone oxidoreductase subunit N